MIFKKPNSLSLLRRMVAVSTRNYSSQRTLTNMQSFLGDEKTGLKLVIQDKPGSLVNALTNIGQAGLNLSFIESYPLLPQAGSNKIAMELEVEARLGSPTFENLVAVLKNQAEIQILNPPVITWFPASIRELSETGKEVMDLDQNEQHRDHPFYSDIDYLKRKEQVTQLAGAHKFPDEEIPIINYNEDEVKAWNICLEQFASVNEKVACQVYLSELNELKKNCGFKPNNVPQLRDLSAYMWQRTGWRTRPVQGFIPLREFLNGLALKIFPTTQFMRHHTEPLFTPQPDIIHMFLGHGPMFLNQEYANITQEIGLASLGASDSVMLKLLAIYLNIIEFGICREGNKPKFYGADLLSSIIESNKAMSLKEQFKPLQYQEIDTTQASHVDLKKNDSSSEKREDARVYLVADTIEDAYKAVKQYTREMKKPFRASYDQAAQQIRVDRRIIREKQ